MSAAPQVKDSLKFDVEVVRGPHTGLRMSFAKAAVTIGRGPENDIVLANDPRASRKHAELKQRGPDLLIVNLSQKNFVLVNGNSVQTEVVSNESLISIGDSELRLHIEASVQSPILTAVPPPAHQKQDLVQFKTAAAPMPRQRARQQPAPPTMPPPSSYQAPPLGPSSGPRSSVSQGNNGKLRFYGLVAVIGLVAWFLFYPDKKGPAKDPNAFRTSELAMADVKAAEKNTEALLTMKKEKYDTVQYRRAQENFVRGFRDYQQGQYARAREAFQVVINLDPDNELAKRYLHLSKLKFDELVKFNMIQGNRYREKKNWRMCQSNYNVVMTMLQHRRDDPTYKEAKQFHEECTLNLEGRF